MEPRMEQKKYEVLRQVFGYDRFRPGQEEVVDRLLEGGDVLAVDVYKRQHKSHQQMLCSHVSMPHLLCHTDGIVDHRARRPCESLVPEQ